LRTNNFQILFSLSFTVLINTFGFAQELPKRSEPINPRVERDTTRINVDSLLGDPVVLKETDSTRLDSVPQKKRVFDRHCHL